MPLTANGKIDRESLPEPQTAAADHGAPVTAPRDDTDRILCGVCTEVLKHPPAGIDDNFFDCGGHSLLAATMVARIEETFDIAMPLGAIFEAPTIRALSARCRVGARLDYLGSKLRSLASGIPTAAALRSAHREMSATSVYRANLDALDRYRRTALPAAPRRVTIFETASEPRDARGSAIDWCAFCGIEPVRVEVPGRDSGAMLSASHAPALASRLEEQLALAFSPA